MLLVFKLVINGRLPRILILYPCAYSCPTTFFLRLLQPLPHLSYLGELALWQSIWQCQQLGEGWLSGYRLRQDLLGLLLMRLGKGIIEWSYDSSIYKGRTIDRAWRRTTVRWLFTPSRLASYFSFTLHPLLYQFRVTQKLLFTIMSFTNKIIKT